VWKEVLPPQLQMLFTYFTQFVIPKLSASFPLWLSRCDLRNQNLNYSTSRHSDWRRCYDNFGITNTVQYRDICKYEYYGIISVHTYCSCYDFHNFITLTNFNWVLCTEVMYIYSSICFKDQTWTWGWPEIGRNMYF
jgi:hypothetical protein